MLPQPGDFIRLDTSKYGLVELPAFEINQNHLFPANFVQVLTDDAYIQAIIPTEPGKCIFQCRMLLPETPKTEKAERYRPRFSNLSAWCSKRNPRSAKTFIAAFRQYE